MSYNKLLFWLKPLKNCKNVNCNNFTVSLPGEQNDLSTKLVQNDCALLHQYPFVLSHMVCFSLSDILALFRNILSYFRDIQSSQPKTFHHETWVKNKNQNCEVYFLIIWMISWICVTCKSAPIFLKDQQIYFSVIKKIVVWVIFPSLLSPICGGGLCSGPFGWISLPYFSFFYDLSPLSWVQFVVVCEPREKLDFKLCHSRLLSISGAQPFFNQLFHQSLSEEKSPNFGPFFKLLVMLHSFGCCHFVVRKQCVKGGTREEGHSNSFKCRPFIIPFI